MKSNFFSFLYSSFLDRFSLSLSQSLPFSSPFSSTSNTNTGVIPTLRKSAVFILQPSNDQQIFSEFCRNPPRRNPSLLFMRSQRIIKHFHVHLSLHDWFIIRIGFETRSLNGWNPEHFIIVYRNPIGSWNQLNRFAASDTFIYKPNFNVDLSFVPNPPSESVRFQVPKCYTRSV